MEMAMRGLLERYEQLVLGKKEAQDNLNITIQLLRELKAGKVSLAQVLVSEDGWQLAESPNGKAAENIPMEEHA